MSPLKFRTVWLDDLVAARSLSILDYIKVDTCTNVAASDIKPARSLFWLTPFLLRG